MFSDHLVQFHPIPAKAWLTLSAGAVFAGLLLAFGMVAHGQVTAAELRESRLVVERLAVSQCVISSNGAERRACIAQISNVAEDSASAPLVDPVMTSFSAQDLQGARPARELPALQKVSFKALR